MRQENMLVNDQIRRKMINYVSTAFLTGGLLGFVALFVYYKGTNLLSTILFSLVFVLVGFVIQLIQKLRLNNHIKDVLYVIVLSVCIPVVTLRFIDFAGITVWAFPFILLFTSLVFSNRFFRISLSVSFVSTQIIIWVLKPQLAAPVDAGDYIVRIGIWGLSLWFAAFVSSIYFSKLNENAEQIRLQKFVTEISSDCLSISVGNFTEKVKTILSKIAAFHNNSGTALYLTDANCLKFVLSQNSDINGAGDVYNAPGEIDLNQLPWFCERVLSDKIIVVADVDHAESADEAERQALSVIKPLIVFPIVGSGTVLGLLAVNPADKKMQRLENTAASFFIISNILADSLVKVNQEKEINFMAYYDYMTNLPNRILFIDRVNQAIHLAARTGRFVAVVFVDIDSFKTVNDSMGHSGGDELIKKVAHELQTRVRKSDAVSRFGGDEFLIMVNNLEAVADIMKIADKVMSLFNEPFVISGHEFFITASAGIGVYPTDGDDAEKLIKNADIAMYKAKESGKNRHLLCTADMKDEVLLKIRLSNNLFRALDRNELILHYQPQVCVETNKIIGVEALIRWNHPVMGQISPAVFIPLAEKTGLINPIGEWVLRTACIQYRSFRAAGLPPVRMAVNVSVIQFRNPNLVPLVRGILRETEMDPQYLELEITETVAMSEADNFIKVLSDLKQLGLTISIDDFGTEYSSLSRLSMLPIDRLKMDIQFVRGINAGEKERAIANGIINLAHTLGLKVIAEGVEDPGQLEFLRQKTCDEVQGFYFYYPTEAEELSSILNREFKPGF